MFEEGVNFLFRQQSKDGSFVSLSSGNGIDFSKALRFHSVFSSALILQSLTKISETKKLKIIKKRLAKFLLSQRSKFWTWNYWTRNSQELKNMPYPDDLDDTFCALSALYLYNPKLITGKSLAFATQVLTSLETQEGGPYKTWLVKKDAPKIWQDVDLGVNANIAYFLYLQKISLPNLNKLFDYFIKKEKFSTPYYPTHYPIIYFLSRFIKGKEIKTKLVSILKKYKPEEPLNIALKIISLVNLGIKTNTLTFELNRLISTQNKNGGWDAATFYTGVNPKKDKKFFAGSAPLTTVFCLEALSLFGNKRTELRYHSNAKVVDRVKTRFNKLGRNLKTEGSFYLKKILEIDKDGQITYLPFLFYKSLKITSNKISNNLIVQLGAASVYGWIAYTIYDNFLDEEGKASSLPIANICLREMTEIFNNVLPANSGFKRIFKKIIDIQEEANTWEVNNCGFDPKIKFGKIKIPNYKDYSFLADRSLGHSLGCIAIVMNLGFKENSHEVKNLLLFFKHFLIARQLNDDAHDWEADLKRGQINGVGALLLSKRENNQNLKELFWNDVVEDVCKLIENNAQKAKSALSKIKIIKDPTLLLKLVEKQEKSVEITRRERTKALQFIKSYK